MKINHGPTTKDYFTALRAEPPVYSTRTICVSLLLPQAVPNSIR